MPKIELLDVSVKTRLVCIPMFHLYKDNRFVCAGESREAVLQLYSAKMGKDSTSQKQSTDEV